MIQRHELKYLIDEAHAIRLRMLLAGRCVPDDNAGEDGTYLCDTLYLDTFDRTLYYATIENEPRRHKLRIRSYVGKSNAVFLEVKRRVDDTIIKSRARVGADWAARLDDDSLLDVVDARTRPAVENFLAYYRTSYAGPMVPTVLVRYEREPYSSVIDPYVRVTMDRKLCYQPKSELSLEPEQRHWMPIDDPIAMRTFGRSTTVLELKFNEPGPAWLRDLVSTLELPRLSFCKYTRAVDAMLMLPGDRAPRLGIMG